MSSQRRGSQVEVTSRRRGLDKTHWLYLAVIAAVVLGVVVGLAFPGKAGFAASLKPMGDAFVSLIKMMITPIIFCTIVLGVGSIAKAATVGKVGGLALAYFTVMTTFALGIGMLVGNIIPIGSGLHLQDAVYKASAEAGSTQEFVLGIIPTSLFSALTSGNI
ncbi:MAG: cation:dicarboxylase symporter family transporter, partial [Specibacter sp.]